MDMTPLFRRFGKVMLVAVLLSASAFATIAYASHSWGGYHWARTASPFTLQLDDNVSTVWDSHLVAASGDWNVSDVLDTTIKQGLTNPNNCKAMKGRVEVCNSKYGNNGWLGVASIWASGNHITQGTVKLNDTYFNTAKYDTPAWRQFVMCQEVGHTFGLDHQDVNFTNANLGTCMDYTNDPDGSLNGQLDNRHPNAHDYGQLGQIYAHLDSVTTVGQTASQPFANGNAADGDDPDRVLRNDSKGRPALYERDLGKGEKLFTFILWADSEG
jgi:hypothetical protein